MRIPDKDKFTNLLTHLWLFGSSNGQRSDGAPHRPGTVRDLQGHREERLDVVTSSSSTPPASSAAVRRRMQATPSRDTRTELKLRRELHRRGLRYRVNSRLPVPPRRHADVVFGPAKVAVFIDGCFWHGCDQHFSPPKSNTEWWLAKIKRTRSRDSTTDELLEKADWLSIRVWEHELPVEAADRIEKIVAARRR